MSKLSLKAAQKLNSEVDNTLEEIDGFYEGCLILNRYVKRSCSIVQGADHDIIYGIDYPNNRMEEYEVKRLSELGWFLYEGKIWAYYV